MGRGRCFEWYTRFKSGRESTEDDLLSGHYKLLSQGQTLLPEGIKTTS